jgi:valyl-tRNA synthetase
MNEKLLKPYDPKNTEARIYKLWEESGFFNPDNLPECKKEAFTIIMPPPNVTGVLHMGHALMLTLEDIMIRYKRMQGHRTLWLPGTDHAAIATQSKVEKDILKKEGLSRHDLGREEMLKRINEFAKQSHDTIISQIKVMGASCDWSREAFTLDEKRNLAVNTMFKNMHDDGLIYRGNRIINWDPKGQTTISDDEIVYEERASKLYTFKYSQDFPISISTSRPETKIGDVAVAVHPEDSRYKNYIGNSYVVKNFCGVELNIKIIADKEVDPAFGTGALGVTPAHSMADWEMADRHDLPRPQVINEYAKIIAGGENILGKKTTEAREIIIAWLRDEGLLEKEEEIKQNVATAERTGGIIEPLPKMQWFVDVNKPIKNRDNKTLKDLMREPFEKGEIKIIPDYFSKTYFHWIENLRDWCISRQIWYGHRIPVWYCLNCNEASLNKPKSKWFLVRHGETDANKEHRLYYNNTTAEIPLNKEGLKQAEESAQSFKNEKIDLIITSHYLRAQQTAQAIARITGAEIILEEEFRERYYGDAEGMTTQEVRKKFPNYFGYTDKSANHENYQEMEERIWKSFSKHYAIHHDKNVVIVGHGGSFRTLLRKIKNIDPSEIGTKVTPLSNAKPFTLEILDPCPKCKGHFFEQDPDTLDTWFSSGLWTFSTLGWPTKTKDLETFHPTDVLETGYEILFFWVARMVLMSEYALGEVPFKNVFLHGTVRDAKGRKMSKSFNNGIDPLEIADKFGADAGRMALIVGTAPGTDSKISEDKIRGYKNFANKIWNITRFILDNVAESDFDNNLEDRLTKEFKVIREDITSDMENYRFHLASEKIYQYIWHRFADEIIEETKDILKTGGKEAGERKIALALIWVDCLKILHPFIPFVTEEIWSTLPLKDKKLLIIEKWPS